MQAFHEQTNEVGTGITFQFVLGFETYCGFGQADRLIMEINVTSALVEKSCPQVRVAELCSGPNDGRDQ